MFTPSRSPCPPESTSLVSGKASWRVCESPEGFDLIREDGVNLVSWHRELPLGHDASFATWADKFPASFDRVISISEGSDDLAMATSGLEEPTRQWVMADIALLLARFACLAGTSRLRVSFGAVRSDQCRKFHMDYIRYRLVTTYIGPGTEWVPESAVHREALALPSDSPWDANKNIIRDASAVRRAAAGDVIVMKGALHDGRGAIHRSPSIEGTGQARIVLIANTIEGS